MGRPFFETLRDIRAGKLLEDLGDELAKLIPVVCATGKSGEITLKLKFKPKKNYVTVEDAISVKLPTLDRGDTLFFLTADNSLSRQDPSQRELELRSVDIETGEIKDAIAG